MDEGLIALTALDLEHLQGILAIFARPGSFVTPRGWLQEVVSRTQLLFGADRVVAGLAGPGEEVCGIAAVGHGAQEVLKNGHNTDFHLGRDHTRPAKGTKWGVYHREVVWQHPSDPGKAVVFQAWKAPEEFGDFLGILVDPQSGAPAGQIAVWYGEGRRKDTHVREMTIGGRGLLLMRLLAPSFRTAVEYEIASGRVLRDIGTLLDRLSVPAFLVQQDGNILFANEAGGAYLANQDDHKGLEPQLRASARRMCAAGDRRSDSEHTHHPTSKVNRRRALKIIGTRVGEGSRAAALLVIPNSRVHSPTQQSLRVRFHLTARQAAVAAWIAEGASTREIAERGRMQPSTVRRHIEAIFSRVGCHSRAELVVQLLALRSWAAPPPNSRSESV